MDKAVTFDTARLHYRRTRFDAVRAAVKRPLLFTAAAITYGGLPFLLPALVPGIGISLLFEGIKYALNRKKTRGEETLLSSLMGELRKQDAPAIANELLKSVGRGEKLLNREILVRLLKDDNVKYNAVAKILETSYKGRTLLGIPFKLMVSRKVCAGLAAIPLADQLIKLNPDLIPFPHYFNTDVSSSRQHSLFLAAVLAAASLASGRRDQQIGLGLILAGGISNLLDKCSLGIVVDYIQVGAWFRAFNLADVSMTAGIILLLWGIIRDR
jgi:hypothetical protein